MKYITLLSGLRILLSQSIHAQDTTTKKPLVFKAKIDEVDSVTKSGYLYAMNDSTIFVSKTAFAKLFMHVNESDLQKLDYTSLEIVHVQRNNSIGKGAIIGSITDLVIGAITGAATGDDPPGITLFRTTAAEKALFV